MRLLAPSLLSALLLALLVPAVASAQARPTRQEVRAMLSGIEDTPSDEDWRRIGEGALPRLIELYTDEGEAPFVRLRAVSATAAFPSGATRTFLLAVARADGQSDLFVREAVNALARGFGRRALDDVASFLEHGEPLVREAAVRSLARIGGDPATRALRARLPAEHDPAVRAWINRALR
jgi:HEAT repeat protein